MTKNQELFRFEIAPHKHLDDAVGRRVAESIKHALDLDVEAVRVVKVFTLSGIDFDEVNTLSTQSVLHDPVLHSLVIAPRQASESAFADVADFIIEVGFRPGVTDNEGHTAQKTLALVLGKKKEDVAAYTSTQYHIKGKLSEKDAQNIAENLLANTLIQRFRIKSKKEWQEEAGFEAQLAKVSGTSSDAVETIDITNMTDNELMAFSRENTLALSLFEMQTIKNYYMQEEIIAQRKADNLPTNPTDAEIEVLAQTWSEHCKHKIFAAKIDYTDEETNTNETISSVYKTYIQNTTKKIRESLGKDDYCKSVFKDNAGVIAFNDNFDVCIKVETHNSPSALDPYGGALTGIVGVNRDPMGTGMGAELICNTDVFCFASPEYNEELPPRLLHPRRVLEGVREGVEHGGNKSGVPTVNGAVVFHERYLGKPLVYCGTVGLMPKELHGKPGWQKEAKVGDAIIMCGGKIGKDGIHGATFSSEELHQDSPATAVQIGDPITQRIMYDFIIKARNLGLYNAITDNGAGGLSSSVGEMAEDTGGCLMDLSKAPLKYDGLRPWEILLSEAQERMTLAVPQEKLEEFLALAKHYGVEANALGTFTDSGYFHIKYKDKDVAKLSMEFMHKGLPQMELKAVWKKPEIAKQAEQSFDLPKDEQNQTLCTMLSRLNICSKEYMIRQYDHEVQGGSVVKPLVGVKQDAPADAAVVRPVLGTEKGIVLSNGICPKFADYDAYQMTANAIDEAVRNAIAVGASPYSLAGCDNYCWCDPVQSERTPDGEYKLAQLVQSGKALDKYCTDYQVPCISGKDSMKNDYTGGGQKISIPPTLLFSVIGSMDDVKLAVTSDFKQAGDLIYILGETKKELAGSELADELKLTYSKVPHVDSQSAKTRYIAIYNAIQAKLITASHDLSDGGFAVALAEMAMGGRLGAKVDAKLIPATSDLTLTEKLYSESASRLLVTVKAENKEAFEKIFAGQVFACIGTVENSSTVNITNDSAELINVEIEELAKAFKGRLSL